MQYRIGSFNLQRFGNDAQKDFAKLAEIMVSEDLDIVALQEIFSAGKGVQRFLEEAVNHELYNWDFCCPERSDQSESSDTEKRFNMIYNDTRGETYAYLWNTKRFKKSTYKRMYGSRVFEPRIINSMGNDVSADCSFFARTPYYARFDPLYGGFFEIRLIDVHIYYGDTGLSRIAKRRYEFDVLTQNIYPDICSARYGSNRTAYTIAMGDYNLNIFSPVVKTEAKNCYLSPVYTYNENGKTINVLTVQDQLTTLKSINPNDPYSSGGYANNFDHFTYSPELSPFTKVTYEAINVVNKYFNGDYAYYRSNISDHLPIVMTVEV